MRFEATPPPSPAEADALAAALERLLGRHAAPPSYTSPWRLAGIRENAQPGDDAVTAAPAAMRPRPKRA